jgi:biopolymer transport protein ExbD
MARISSPSSRRKGGSDLITLNLVPILDAMVTLIGFLLFTTSFLVITSIETPMPQASSTQNEEQLKEKPLQLTVSVRNNETEIWSPFEKIQKKIVPNLSTGQPDLKSIHESLLEIKKQFPSENKIVLVPYAGATYDILVALMDTARLFDTTDPAIFAKNPKTQIDEKAKLLFPEVVFGNLLGDAS